ncbi:MAG: phosphopantothenate/pantothenate synthetase [Deltaproteobacteria bacterium]|nr:phosphopantothenate/pantothenate synthetase [Deltaproteobacteria bacterium]
MKIPSSHPRARSLRLREKIVSGVQRGITSRAGLIAHGRGEAFDYLLGEKTHPFAWQAIQASAIYLLTARCPVISVNGNVAALIGPELARFSNRWKIPLEVNIFHYDPKREHLLIRYLKQCGAAKVLGSHCGSYKILKGLGHPRRKMNLEGIAKADVVFVPLEDGDRCQALRRIGKKVVTVDLNPLSRTARSATVTIVDELTRCFPKLDQAMARLSRKPVKSLRISRARYNNKIHLTAAEKKLRGQF